MTDKAPAAAPAARHIPTAQEKRVTFFALMIVGFLWMKAARGPEAIIISPTAMITAAAMIGSWSVIPTAVRMLSTEKTRSSTSTCTMAEAKLMPARAAGPASSCAAFSGSTF